MFGFGKKESLHDVLRADFIESINEMKLAGRTEQVLAGTMINVLYNHLLSTYGNKENFQKADTNSKVAFLNHVQDTRRSQNSEAAREGCHLFCHWVTVLAKNDRKLENEFFNEIKFLSEIADKSR